MESYENALATYLEGLKCDPNNLEVLDGLRGYLSSSLLAFLIHKLMILN